MALRIEDLDPDRSKAEYAGLLEQDLRWLGLDWDEGGAAGGPGAPYRQSLRGFYYEQALERLAELGLAYPCFCTRAQLHAAEAPHRADGRFVYPGTCRGLAAADASRLYPGRKPAVRLRLPDRELSFTDLHYGLQCLHLGRDCGDLVVRRADGVFAYQLAVVVDDGLMGIDEVVRGADLLDSAPPQIWLHQALGFVPPRFGHVPLLLAEDGRRLSKRDRDLDLGRLRALGVSSQRLTGFLAWLSGLTDRPEPLSARELVPLFSWDRVARDDIRLTADRMKKLLP